MLTQGYQEYTYHRILYYLLGITMEQLIVIEYFKDDEKRIKEIKHAETMTLKQICSTVTLVLKRINMTPAQVHDIYIAEKRNQGRSYFLQKAHKLIHRDRNDSYGEPTDNFERIAMGWNIIVNDGKITPDKVALCMVWLKIARLVQTPNDVDGYTDICGYASIAGELANYVSQKSELRTDVERRVRSHEPKNQTISQKNNDG